MESVAPSQREKSKRRKQKDELKRRTAIEGRISREISQINFEEGCKKIHQSNTMPTVPPSLSLHWYFQLNNINLRADYG